MPVYSNPWFLLPALTFWINQYLERVQGIYFPLVHSYLDDLLAMPVILGLTLQLYRWIHPRKERLVFSIKQVLVGFLYISLLFEVLLPAWSATYVRDPWDVGCYFLGSVYFYGLINKKQNET
ncbi:hypothetical protein SAMN05192553_102468 [Cyclobacterium xiamenense]|uniref:Magnesium citrate secondary transporter n=1 Tax=Cyclobacterium xiamenense TaxID=1297121 RepID=A0A1H6W7K6_9BACT|nr:magnesium citrate secondary transporter [Cyclobacterium xiamenense]SEJ11746.1 hypothetical protein SAMN05192553_102468 [Cyclobacterium xiamenense]